MTVTHTHSLSLMVVAILVSIVAAFTGLALTRNIARLPETTRKTLVSMSSIVIGGGIWSMHFIAMLANRYSVPVGYDVAYTLGSGLVSILMVGIALLILHYTPRSIRVLNLAGIVLAAGIVMMHYIGMNGLRGVTPHFGIPSIILTLIFALISCVCAVRVAYGKRSRDHIAAGGLLLGLSVVVVHYTAMIGIHYQASRDAQQGTIAIADSMLAIVLVVAVFVICGAFLLVSATFLTSAGPASMPTDPTATPQPELPPGPQTTQPSVEAATHSPSSSSISSHSAARTPASDDAARADPSAPSDAPAIGSAVSGADPTPVRIPYEKNKKLWYVESDDVGAIRADGRYTQLYTRNGVFFCPWSITEAENTLQDKAFYRSHRSYLINIDRMSAFEKRKDSGVCLFDDIDQLSKVPVSRTRVSGLLVLLGHG